MSRRSFVQRGFVKRGFVKRIMPAVIAAAMVAGAPTANAVQFQGVYVFGDSLSDAGYYRPFLLSIGVPAATAATLGRFTTNPGPVWSEIIAQYYGGNPNPSNVAGGGIFAQGGARLTLSSVNTPAGSPQRPITAQIAEHLSATGGSANPNGLYAIWAGANDLLQAGAAGVASANDVAAQSARLRAAGARYIAVFGLPNLGLTPGALAGGAAGVALSTQASAGFNITLFNALAATNQRVIPVDVFSMLNEVAANASAYGFTNISATACGPFPPFAPAGNSSQFCTAATLVPGATPSNYLFADNNHPTSAAHVIVADLFKSLIDGPNAYSVMAEVPLSSRAAHVRTLDSGLMQGATAEVGKVTAFAAYDGGKTDISTSNLNPQTNTKNRAATVGVTMRVSESVTVGVAAGKNNNEARMGAVGQFDVDENTISFFGSAKSGGLYANASFSIAVLKYNNIQRYVKFGNVMRTNRASATGTNTSGNLMVGYDFGTGAATFGPFVGWTSQQVTVGNFQENAGAATALSTDLKIDGQSRNSSVLSGGVRASIKMGSFTPYVRVSFDRDEANKERFVTASPVTVTQNIKYDIPAYRADDSWVTGVIGVRGNITPQVGFGLAYTAVSSKTGVKQDGVTANVSFAF
ncbi:MAG: autotransporter domain-containing protein [Aeromicrobium sp.]|nr:autotransporter domain-containing protein [Burkholderiales bacterium]